MNKWRVSQTCSDFGGWLLHVCKCFGHHCVARDAAFVALQNNHFLLRATVKSREDTDIALCQVKISRRNERVCTLVILVLSNVALFFCARSFPQRINYHAVSFGILPNPFSCL